MGCYCRLTVVENLKASFCGISEFMMGCFIFSRISDLRWPLSLFSPDLDFVGEFSRYRSYSCAPKVGNDALNNFPLASSITLPVFISFYALYVDYNSPLAPPPHVFLSLVGDNDTLTGLSYLLPVASDRYLLIASDAYLEFGEPGLSWIYFFHSRLRPPSIILSARTFATSRDLSCESL